jgi:hypothetical protein
MPPSKKQIKHLHRARKEVQRYKAANNPELNIPADLLGRLDILDPLEVASSGTADDLLADASDNGFNYIDPEETEQEVEYSDTEDAVSPLADTMLPNCHY